MKRKLQMIIGACAASVLAVSALAQVTPPTSNKDGPEYNEDRMHHAQRADRLNGAAKASDLIGMTVKNYQNEKLGKVEDLAVDVESGRVVQVIVSTGGFIGIGDTLTAVPPGAFHHDVAQKVLHLDANKEKLQNAPKFEMSKWADYSDSNHLAQVYPITAKNLPWVLSKPGIPWVRPTPFHPAKRTGPGTRTASRVTANG